MRNEPRVDPPTVRDHYAECPENADQKRSYYWTPAPCKCEALEHDYHEAYAEALYEYRRGI